MTSEKNRSPKTVLLTAAGAPATLGLIECLQSKGYRVLATDIDPKAPGLYTADRGYVIPRGDSFEFIPALREISRSEKVDAIVPLVDEELLSVLDLEKDGIIVLLPRFQFVAACLDKFQLMKMLQTAGIAVPKTALAIDGTGDIHFPMVVKPRTGRGSRGVRNLKSEQEFVTFYNENSHKLNELILQEYIDGTEFTVSVVVWRDGEVQTVVPKEIVYKQGVTKIAITRHNDKIDKLCRKVQETMRADGPFNVQLRLNSENDPYIFEINPRFSSTSSLTNAAGIDELNGLLKQALFGRQSYHFGEWKEGIVLLRGTLDHFLEERLFLSSQKSFTDTKVYENDK